MPGEVTALMLEEIKGRLAALESREIRDQDEMKGFFREEWPKIDRISFKLDALTEAMQVDRKEHHNLAIRVARCETGLIDLKTQLLKSTADMEKKFLKLVAVGAALAGSVGGVSGKLLSVLLGS